MEDYEAELAGLDALAKDMDFEDLYGFPHNCHCKTDWEEGKVGMVSECYTELCDDALNRCHKFKGEAAESERALARLRLQITELGADPRA